MFNDIPVYVNNSVTHGHHRVSAYNTNVVNFLKLLLRYKLFQCFYEGFIDKFLLINSSFTKSFFRWLITFLWHLKKTQFSVSFAKETSTHFDRLINALLFLQQILKKLLLLMRSFSKIRYFLVVFVWNSKNIHFDWTKKISRAQFWLIVALQRHWQKRKQMKSW